MELTLEQINANEKLWGEDLFQVFGDHIDENGWLTNNGWSDILENEIPKFDKHYNDNPLHKETYQRMYSTEFEVNEDESMIRPVNN